MRPISFKQRVDEIFIEKLQQLSREMIISSPIGGSELANRETMNEKGKMKKRGREKTKTGVSNKRFNQIFIGGKLGNFQPNDNFSFVRQIREINKTEEIKNRAKRERERERRESFERLVQTKETTTVQFDHFSLGQQIQTDRRTKKQIETESRTSPQLVN